MAGVVVSDRQSFYETGGRRFPFSDEYFTTLAAVRPLSKIAALPVYSGSYLDEHASKVDDVSFQVFLAKYYDYALLVDVLASQGKLRRFGAALDIGSGPALQARLLKLTGWTTSCEASDIYDARRRCSDRTLQKYGRRLRWLYAGYRVQKMFPRQFVNIVPKLRRLNAAFPVGASVFGYRPDLRAYGAQMGKVASLDGYHVGDILSHSGSYDLVTSFMSLEYLRFTSVAAKVSECLKPKGIFAFIAAHWWYPINNTLLYGRFPYLLQQLTTDEVSTYYRVEHPQLDRAGIDQRMTYSDLDRPTIADYEATARRHGLMPVAAVPLRPENDENNSRAVWGPGRINRLPGWSLDTVLANAQSVHASVTRADLTASHVLMVFEKL